jgi:hypothetical protein
VSLNQLWLVIKEIKMARRTSHEELNHPFRLGPVMSFLQNSATPGLTSKKRGQGHPSEAATGLPQKITSVCHRFNPRRKIHSY